jgi:hypothetical protein
MTIGGDARPWDAIAYGQAPVDRLVAPEHHWPAIAEVPMTREQRLGMNNLAMRFSCEMVAHFERYVVDYLEKKSARLAGALPPRAIARFATDERNHISGFLRLLAALRPAAYPEPRLAFFRWDFWDQLVVDVAPAVTFFMATDLLEEMFLHVPAVMEERPEDCYGPALAVMQLHAREERSHLGMDEKVLHSRRRAMSTWRFTLQALAGLFIILLVDRKTSRAWRRAVREQAAELKLDEKQLRVLERKGLSLSDILGIKAYIERRRERPFPGSRLFCAALSLALPKAQPSR